MDTLLRGALVGAGRVSANHLQAWARIPRVEIVAVADPDLAKAGERAQAFDIDAAHVYAGLAELLDAEAGLDFVDIATRPQTHPELVGLAAARGLHVNCQKPFALSLADARAMIRACRDAGVVLNVNENWRWRSWYRETRQMIVEGRIGRPAYARFFLHSDWFVHRRQRQVPPDHPRRRVKRGVVFEMGIHLIDVSRFLFGEPESVYARMTHNILGFDAEDRAVITLAFGDAIASVDMSANSIAPWGMPNRHQHNVEDARIEGERGTIVLVPHPRKGDLIRLVTEDGEWERPAYACTPMEAYLDSYRAAQGHFVDCLLNGLTPETHALDNYETLATTLAAYRSAELNQVVRISDYKELS